MSQAELDFKQMLFQEFHMCAWEARLVSPIARIELPNATLYQLYVQSVHELKGEK